MAEFVTRTYVEFYGANGVPLSPGAYKIDRKPSEKDYLPLPPRQIPSRDQIGPIPTWCNWYITFEMQETAAPDGEKLFGKRKNISNLMEAPKPIVEAKLANELPPLTVTAEMRDVIEKGKAERAAKAAKS